MSSASIIVSEMSSSIFGYHYIIKDILYAKDIQYLKQSMQDNLEMDDNRLQALLVDVTEVSPEELFKTNRLFGLCEYINDEIKKTDKNVSFNLVIDDSYKRYYPDLIDVSPFNVLVWDIAKNSSVESILSIDKIGDKSNKQYNSIFDAIKSRKDILLLLISLTFALLLWLACLSTFALSLILMDRSFLRAVIAFSSGLLLYESTLLIYACANNRKSFKKYILSSRHH